jgi:hypothetical protein
MYVLSFIIQNRYRITTVLKVETGIITSISASLIGRVVIIVIVYVIVFICDVIMRLTSHFGR